MSTKQLQQRWQILARLDVNLSLKQVCDTLALQTETKTNRIFAEYQHDLLQLSMLRISTNISTVLLFMYACITEQAEE